MSIGIDLGTHSIKMVQLTAKGKTFEVSHFALEEISSQSREEIVEKLKKLLQGLPKKKGEMVVSIPSQKAIFRELLIPFQDEEKIAQVVKAEAEPFLHGKNLEDVVLNYYKSREVGSKSKLLLTCLTKENIKTHLEIYRSARINPSQIDIDLSSLYNFLLATDILDKEKTQAVVDIGKTSVKILLVERGKLQLMRSMHFRSLPEWMEEDPTEDPSLDDTASDDKTPAEKEEDSYEAFKTLYNAKKKKKSSSARSSTISARANIYDPELEGTGMFEIFQDEPEDDLSEGDLDLLGVEESQEEMEVSFSGEWDFVGDEALGEQDDTAFLLLDGEIATEDHGSGRMPIAVLSDEEFEALDIYEDFDEVAESDLDRFYHRILQEVERSLIYGGTQTALDEIILTGGGSKSPEIVTFFEALFEVTVTIPDLSKMVKSPYRKDFSQLGLVAAGLALEGLDDRHYNATRFNFRKEEFQYERKYEKIKKSLALTFFLTFLIFFVWFQSLRAKLRFTEFQIHKVKKNQLKVYNTLFLPIAPKEKPLYPDNILESIKDKERELKRELGDSPEVPKITSALKIFKEISRIVETCGVSFKLVSLSISQRGVQLNISIANSQQLSRLEGAFQATSKLLEVTGSQFNNPLSNIQFALKK